MANRRPKPNWKQLREQLLERSGGYCEVSGRVLDPETFDAHHRRPKRMGGTSRPDTDLLSNLLALDPGTHNAAARGARSVHGSSLWSMACGYLLHDDAIPALAPVLIMGRRWVLLGEHGEYVPQPLSDAAPSLFAPSAPDSGRPR
jgi:hypothetical protein